MTIQVRGFEFAVLHHTTATTTYSHGTIVLVREGSPEHWRATCQTLNSMWERTPERAFDELVKLARDSRVAAAEVLVLVGGET